MANYSAFHWRNCCPFSCVVATPLGGMVTLLKDYYILISRQIEKNFNKSVEGKSWPN